MAVDIGGEATGPLAGIRVIDISTVVSGPLCAQILGDLGADVVKVEPLHGDTARHLDVGPEPAFSGLFAQFNRNKRSVALDLKSEPGRDAFRRLAIGADVVVENYRPGVSDRLGIGYESLRQENPRLVWVAISGFGPDGPYAEQPCYDMVIQGMAGFAKILGDDENPKLVSNLIADKTSGMTAAYAVLAALVARERNGGRGQRVDVPMLDAFSAFVLPDTFSRQTFGPAPVDRSLEAAIYRAWKTADGHVTMIVIEDHQFEAMCKVLDREDLASDERFATLPARLANASEIFPLIESEIAKWTTADLVERAHRFQAPLGPVNDIESFMRDPQVRSNETVFDVEDPRLGTMRLFRSPPRYSETPTNVRHLPPRLGEHTEEVLAEAGLSSGEIAKLRGG